MNKINVFISYSADNIATVHQFAAELEAIATVRYWDESKEPGNEAWKDIFKWIDASDVVITIITDKTVARAMAVGQEIGYAKKGGKLIIPFVAKGVEAKDLGCLGNVTYETLVPEEFPQAIERLKLRISSIKESQEAVRNLLLIGAIIGFVWVFFSKKK